MTASEFLDSNVLVYAYDSVDRRKSSIARDLVRRAIDGQVVASSQVLGEFAVTLLHKMSPPAVPYDVLAILDGLGPIQLIPVDSDTVRRAVEAKAEYGIHFYDGMIVAAAERGGCRMIWSEDLNPKQRYFDIEVLNPFA
jgi:predicted nucleic acid-binding protein